MKHTTNFSFSDLFNNDEKEVSNILLELEELLPKRDSKRGGCSTCMRFLMRKGPKKVNINRKERSSMENEDGPQEPPPSLEQSERLVKIGVDSPEATAIHMNLKSIEELQCKIDQLTERIVKMRKQIDQLVEDIAD
ncbi:unnamed protein product [Dovyalis caffra]|uniref:Uncharacterized protein n=1 Tax=Dovyalis caffra TaxID=77055 RepID=A0AAV1S7U4_9ROSI|nr:unnamed protein product [Dovyalis caffra]